MQRRFATIRTCRCLLTDKRCRSHLSTSHTVDGIVDEYESDVFTAVQCVDTLGCSDTSHVAVALIGEDKTLWPQTLDGRSMKVLTSRWQSAIDKAQKTQRRPQLIYEETGRAVAMLRDLFNPTYENIYVNDEEICKEVKDYVAMIAPEKAGIVKMYTGKVPIFDNFNVTKQIKASFGKTVNYAHGAYLIIEHTEAMHVVDVNSGNRSKNQNGQEGTALDTNLGAADELARQLRLRDMGGIIVVDFIDMNLAEDRQMLY